MTFHQLLCCNKSTEPRVEGYSWSRDGRHLARQAAEIGRDRGERAKAEEGVEVEDGHAAAAGQLVQLHAEPGDVHHRLDQRGDERRQVITKPLHIARDTLVHVLLEHSILFISPRRRLLVRLKKSLAVRAKS